MKIMVGIPTLSGKIPVELVNGIHEAMARTGYSIFLHFERGATPVDVARNRICYQFLKTDCDVLWMIDDDTLTPENIADLFSTEADILAPIVIGAHPVEQGAIGLFNVAYLKNERGDWRTINWEVRGSGVIDVDAVGTGCILIKRRVLEDPRMKLPGGYVNIYGEEKVLDENDPPALFKITRKPNGEWTCGEDLGFCDRAQKLGYSIKLHTEVVCGHLKEIDLKTILVSAKSENIICSGSSS